MQNIDDQILEERRLYDEQMNWKQMIAKNKRRYRWAASRAKKEKK